MIPDAQIEDLLELFEKYDEKDTPRDTLIDALLSNLSEETILSDEDALSTVQKNALKEEVASVLSKLTPKGNDINKKGITPNVEAELSEGSADWTELTHEEDTQLQTALKEIGQS